ncbi:phasin family protein [Bifidobacterium aesculapii]|uniref:phasin family protein n=1 Tax=Bifidobacterium aesculapii TaxID=1329411 RepID=UPI0006E3F496|nr:phasin family protein [Bifidobacterium aesculapii]
MADFDLGDGLRKVVLAGIGALATGYEKGSELVDDLVKKGELTVEQGKSLNTELKRKVGESLVNDAAKDDAKRAAKAEGAEAPAAEAEGADKPSEA